jgi:hypothetical protein
LGCVSTARALDSLRSPSPVRCRVPAEGAGRVGYCVRFHVRHFTAALLHSTSVVGLARCARPKKFGKNVAHFFGKTFLRVAPSHSRARVGATAPSAWGAAPARLRSTPRSPWYVRGHLIRFLSCSCRRGIRAAEERAISLPIKHPKASAEHNLLFFLLVCVRAPLPLGAV